MWLHCASILLLSAYNVLVDTFVRFAEINFLRRMLVTMFSNFVCVHAYCQVITIIIIITKETD